VPTCTCSTAVHFDFSSASLPHISHNHIFSNNVGLDRNTLLDSGATLQASLSTARSSENRQRLLRAKRIGHHRAMSEFLGYAVERSPLSPIADEHDADTEATKARVSL